VLLKLSPGYSISLVIVIPFCVIYIRPETCYRTDTSSLSLGMIVRAQTSGIYFESSFFFLYLKFIHADCSPLHICNKCTISTDKVCTSCVIVITFADPRLKSYRLRDDGTKTVR
jgi:uncharacterized membrane protein